MSFGRWEPLFGSFASASITLGNRLNQPPSRKYCKNSLGVLVLSAGASATRPLASNCSICAIASSLISASFIGESLTCSGANKSIASGSCSSPASDSSSSCASIGCMTPVSCALSMAPSAKRMRFASSSASANGNTGRNDSSQTTVFVW